MSFIFKHKIKAAFIIFVFAFVAIGLFIRQNHPFSVKQYKTVTLGMQAAEGPGTYIGWGLPDRRVPEESEFFVYSLGDKAMCLGSSCGVGGYFIECLGGWLSGYKYVGEVADYGLSETGVNMEKQKIITVADKDAKIVGIYLGAHIRNLPYIMRNHRDLVPEERFKACSDLLPSRWK